MTRSARCLVRAVLAAGLTAPTLPVAAAADSLDYEQIWAAIRQEAVASAARAGAVQPNPRASKQLDATSASRSSAGPVDRASFPEFLAVALDNDLVQVGEANAFTLSLNLFAFVQAARPSVNDDVREYGRYAALRRLGGKVSFGGKGESFDRDGDGQADEALSAKQLGDQVTWEVSYRVFGSRDRRDRAVIDRITRAALVDKQLDSCLRAEERIGRLLQQLFDEPGASETEVPRDRFDEWFRRKEVQEAVADSRQSCHSFDGELEAARQRSDRSLVVTIAAGGTDRKEEFGPRRRQAALRALWGTGAFDHTVNLDWSREQGLGGAPDPVRWKLAYEATAPILTDLFDPQNPARLSLDAAYERFDHVPDAKHRTVARVGGKLELPFKSGVTIPLSVTWANHADLLSDAQEVIGRVGISFDLSQLRGSGSSKE